MNVTSSPHMIHKWITQRITSELIFVYWIIMETVLKLSQSLEFGTRWNVKCELILSEVSWTSSSTKSAMDFAVRNQINTIELHRCVDFHIFTFTFLRTLRPSAVQFTIFELKKNKLRSKSQCGEKQLHLNAFDLGTALIFSVTFSLASLRITGQIIRHDSRCHYSDCIRLIRSTH